tara:strand:+ start:89 stop:274 length:186 start_codon:yes stop_codon:yes gene_type:complete
MSMSREIKTKYTQIGVREYEHKLVVEALYLLANKKEDERALNDVQIINDLIGDIEVSREVT